MSSGPTIPPTQTPDAILAARAKIAAEFGDWTSHAIELAPGVFTVHGAPEAAYITGRARMAARTAEMVLAKPITQMRTLDLGCLEGGLAHNLARFGAESVGLEARIGGVEKARWAARTAGLANVSYFQGDMLKLADYALGSFDLIVAAGVLYHVNAPELLPFLRSLKAHCRGILYIDSHISHAPLETYEEEGHRYFGRSYVEHVKGMTQAQKDTRLWASLENDFSFWLTERSLANMLVDAGFTYVFRPLAPVLESPARDRAVWVADARADSGVGAEIGRLREPDRRPHEGDYLMSHQQVHARNPSTRSI